MTIFLEILIKFFSKPSNIVIVVLLTILLGMGMNIFGKNIKISSLESKLEKSNITLDKIKSEREQEKNIYESNIVELKSTIEEFNAIALEWQDVITDKNIQIKKEQDRIEYWKKLYVNKVCVNNDDEIVKPTQGVISDTSNVKVLTQINRVFGVGE